MITISQAQASKKKYPITPNELVPLKPNFGRIDCSAAESSPLCHRFFMTPKIIPQLFVVVPNTTTTITEVDYVYENQTLRRPEAVYTTDVGLWRVPLNQNTTTADMIEFYNTKGWEKLTPWNGLLNPIDGKLAPVGEYIGILYRWYKFVPQWILMMGMSFFAKYLTYVAFPFPTETMWHELTSVLISSSKFIPAASTTPRTKKEKKEKKEKREKKEKKEAAVPAAAPPPAIAINGKST